MRIQWITILLGALPFLFSCARNENEAKGRTVSAAEAGPQFLKKPAFSEVYPVLTGTIRDKQSVVRPLIGLFVDWEVYVIGPWEWDPKEVERLKQNSSIVADKKAALIELAQYPQRYIVAPSPNNGKGIVMRVGDGFNKRNQFGRIISEFPVRAKLRVKGRTLLNDGIVELCVYDVDIAR